MNTTFRDAEITMAEPAPSQLELWRARLRHLWTRTWRVALFGSGVAAALLAVLIYQVFAPRPHLLTTKEVSDTVAQALASVTPQPAVSEGVYQVIKPSLVLVQVDAPGVDG